MKVAEDGPGMSDQQTTNVLIAAFISGILFVGSATALIQAFTGKEPGGIIFIAFLLGGIAAVVWRMSIIMSDSTDRPNDSHK